MKNINQKGFAHLTILFAVITVTSFAGVGTLVYKRNQAQRTVKINSEAATVQEQQNDARNQSELPPAETQIKPDVPSAASETSSPEPAPASSPTPTSTAPSAPPKSQQRSIQFTKGGGSQQGDSVIVSGYLSESHAGTCVYEFYLNGTLRVGKSNASSGNKCYMEIPTSVFPKSATYSFILNFVSSDSSVAARQNPYDISIK